MSRVFLSHSHADKPFARRLAADLRAAGHDVWIDEAEINIGDSLIQKIREGIDEVDYVAAIISAASVASPWVQRELDIASNREIEEKRVLVLPLLLEKVELPGFMKGKFYGDFTDLDRYEDGFSGVLRALGAGRAMPKLTTEEVGELRARVQALEALARERGEALEAHQKAAMRGKSPALVEAIEKANKDWPGHAPINSTYAFEALGRPITLDYLLWGMSKAQREGMHILDVVFTLDNKWDEVRSMLEAYSDLLAASGR